jgi:hypothetical protein
MSEGALDRAHQEKATSAKTRWKRGSTAAKGCMVASEPTDSEPVERAGTQEPRLSKR